MDEVKLFVTRLIRQTKEDLELERRKDPLDEWVRFLEGKLLAFQLVEGFIQKVEEKKGRLH